MDEQKIWDSVLEKSGYPRGLPHLTKAVKKLMTPEEAEMLLQMPASAEELAPFVRITPRLVRGVDGQRAVA